MYTVAQQNNKHPAENIAQDTNHVPQVMLPKDLKYNK